MAKDNERKNIESVGASIRNISICINPNTLYNILDETIQSFNKPDKKGKKSIAKQFEIVSKKEVSREQITQYLKDLESLKAKKKRMEKTTYLKNLPKQKLIPKGILLQFKKDFLAENVSKYLEIIPCVIEQNKKKNNLNGNIFYDLKLEEYKKIHPKTKFDDYEYLLWVIKILLFLDLSIILRNHNFKMLTVDSKILLNIINEKIENSIITGLEVTDTLKLKKYLYGDYFYELAQLGLSNNYLVTDTPKKMSLNFVFKEFKKYLSKYTPEQQDAKAMKTAVNKMEKDLDKVLVLSEQDIEEAKENNPSISEEDENIIKNGYLTEYFLGKVFNHDSALSFNSKANSKAKIKIILGFRKDKDPKKAVLLLKISGEESIHNLLFSEEEQKHKIHTKDIIKRIISNNAAQIIIDGGMFQFLDDLEEAEGKFDTIKKSLFTSDVKFIKANVKGERNLIAKAVLAVLASQNKIAKKKIFNTLTESSQKDLDKLIKILQKKNRRNENGEKVITILYEFYKDKINAK